MRGNPLSKPRPDYEYRASFQPRSQRYLGYTLVAALLTWLMLITTTHYWLNGDSRQRTTISINKKNMERKPASPAVKCVAQIAGGGNDCGK